MFVFDFFDILSINILLEQNFWFL